MQNNRAHRKLSFTFFLLLGELKWHPSQEIYVFLRKHRQFFNGNSLRAKINCWKFSLLHTFFSFLFHHLHVVYIMNIHIYFFSFHSLSLALFNNSSSRNIWKKISNTTTLTDYFVYNKKSPCNMNSKNFLLFLFFYIYYILFSSHKHWMKKKNVLQNVFPQHRTAHDWLNAESFTNENWTFSLWFSAPLLYVFVLFLFLHRLLI